MRDARPSRVPPADMQALGPALALAVAHIAPKKVIISGGEPTLVPNLAAVVSTIRDLGVRPSLCTNATLVGRARAEDLARAGLQSATVGVEGLDDAYQSVRHGRATFQDALAGMKAFAGAGVSVTVNLTFGCNLVDSACSLVAALRDVQVDAVTITAPMVQGRLRRMLPESPFDMPDYRRLFDCFVSDLKSVAPWPVAVRTPRCDVMSCPSGKTVFSMDGRGHLRGCPDVGATNILDLGAGMPHST